MNHFIYVYSKDARQKLLDAGFVLIKDHPQTSISVFANINERTERMMFALNEISYLLSDTLSF